MYSSDGATNKGIHVPIYSSIIIVRGSGLQYFSMTFEVQLPKIVTTTIKLIVIMVNTQVDTN